MLFFRFLVAACLCFAIVFGMSVRDGVAGSSKHRSTPNRQGIGALSLLNRPSMAFPVLTLRTVPKHSKMKKALYKSLGKALDKILSRYRKEVRASRAKKGCLRVSVNAVGRKGWLRFRKHKHTLKSQVVRKALVSWLEKERRAVQSILQRFRPKQATTELLFGFSKSMWKRGCPVSIKTTSMWKSGSAMGIGRLGLRGSGGGGGGGVGVIGHKGRASKRRSYRRTKRRHVVSLRPYQILSLRLGGKLNKASVKQRLRNFVRRARRCLKGRVVKKLQPVRVFLSIRGGKIVKMRLTSEQRTLYFNHFCLKRRVPKRWSRAVIEQGTIYARIVMLIL